MLYYVTSAFADCVCVKGELMGRFSKPFTKDTGTISALQRGGKSWHGGIIGIGSGEQTMGG